MSNKKLIDLFLENYENCSLSSKIEIHNTYVRECSYSGEDEIEDNDEDFFNTFYENKPMEAVRATFYGKYRFNDDYVWLNAYGNLDSGTYESQLPLTNAEDMAEWYVENYNELSYITEMESFCYACENGEENEEENEEESEN